MGLMGVMGGSIVASEPVQEHRLLSRWYFLRKCLACGSISELDVVRKGIYCRSSQL